MNYRLAEKLVQEFISIRGRLDSAVREIQSNCEEEEFKFFRRAIGGVMGELFLEVLTPIYKQHPGLIPPELRRGGKGPLDPEEGANDN